MNIDDMKKQANMNLESRMPCDYLRNGRIEPHYPYPDFYGRKPMGNPMKKIENEIDPLDLFFYMWDRIWFFIVIAIIGAAIAFAYTKYMVTPTYLATSKMYIHSSSYDEKINQSDLNVASNMAHDYQELMRGREVMQGVVDELNLSIDAGTLKNMVSFRNPTDTHVIYIQVISTSPELSASIANEIVRQTQIFIGNFMEIDIPVLYEAAIKPASRYSPSYKKNIMFGAMAGIVLVGGFFLLIYLMDNTIHDQEELTALIGVAPLSIIPEDGKVLKRKRCKIRIFNSRRHKRRKERKKS